MLLLITFQILLNKFITFIKNKHDHILLLFEQKSVFFSSLDKVFSPEVNEGMKSNFDLELKNIGFIIKIFSKSSLINYISHSDGLT
jgi:hypothetical protein